MKKIGLTCLLFLWLSNIAMAAESYGDFNFVQLIKTTSAKSFMADIPGSHPLIGRNIEVVLKGIDVPKRTGVCKNERTLALQGEELLGFLLGRSKNITLHNVERGRRFQLVATVWADGKDIRQILMAKKLAVTSVSGKRGGDWCPK